MPKKLTLDRARLVIPQTLVDFSGTWYTVTLKRVQRANESCIWYVYRSGCSPRFSFIHSCTSKLRSYVTSNTVPRYASYARMIFIDYGELVLKVRAFGANLMPWRIIKCILVI